MSGTTTPISTQPSFTPGAHQYDAADARLAMLGNILPGLFQPGDLEVSQRAAGANMSVDIAAGRCFVDPQDDPHQGVYLAHLKSADAPFNTLSDGGYAWTAAHGSNPRIDLVCVEVGDEDFGGSFTGWRFRIVTGTANAGANHPLAVTHWPTIPAGCVPIAAVRVEAAATTIIDANIVNLNAIGGVGRAATSNVDSVQTTTSTSYTRLATPDFVCVYVPHDRAGVRFAANGMVKISSASGTQAISLFVNDTQLSVPDADGAPSQPDGGSNTLSTVLGRFATADGGANYFSIGPGSGSDVTDVTTGMALRLSSVGGSPIDIVGMTAGWKVIEMRYKTSANTLTVQNRKMWAEVVA
jgi:hypothetical protein